MALFEGHFSYVSIDLNVLIECNRTTRQYSFWVHVTFLGGNI
jgi:uncharacterized metal-binding protein YceD (DUF177 family)